MLVQGDLDLRPFDFIPFILTPTPNPAKQLPARAVPRPKGRVVPFGTVLDLRTTTSQKCVAVPRRARIEGS